ncbi:MAG TPA: S9 family peptidase [Flavobacteriales bacterium]
MQTIANPSPPQAAKDPHVLEAHGQQRMDEYHWMRLSEEQRNAAEPDAHTARVMAHLQAENAYSDAVMAPIKDIQESLFAEMKARIKETDMSVPYRENGYWYSFRYEEGKEYPIHMRGKALPDGSAPNDFELLLDENKLAEGHTFFDLNDLEVSPDNRLMVYSQDTVGRRQYEIRFRDIATGMDLPDRITNTSGGGAFADSNTFFYARKDRTLRSYRIFRHILGTDEKSDVVVYHEKDPAYSCDVYRSRSERFVVISTDSTMSSEEWLLPVSDPLGAFKVFATREEEHEYSIQHVPGFAPDGSPAPGKFYIVTNWEARNFRLMECPENATDKASWKEVIPHREDVMLEDVDLFKGHMVVSERREGLVHLRIQDLASGQEREIAFNDPAYVAYSGTNPEWDSTGFRYGYASLTTPSSVYEQDLVTGMTVLLKQQEVIGEFDPRNYHSERIEATAKDGTRIPISLVYRKGTPRNGTAPLLLYGYGSYGINVEPNFSSARLSLLDRGFIFAIAHIRGGEELGRAWYENGRMEHKMNTFTDFIACGEHLKAQGYADPARLYCMGGSAGGLLVGAVLNMRPDLWGGAVAEVPFVDVVTTMLDDSIPLTTGEYDEWGDPNEREAYDRMLAYSPYDNVKPQRYPALLVTTGYHDSQVQYWEPAKWVARLREHQQGDAPILMHTNMEAGHGGASGRFERLKEVARIYAFLLQRAGLARG